MEAILSVRNKFRDELMSFREAVSTTAFRLAAAGDDLSTADSHALIQDQFIHPLNDLRRRLNHGDRDLAANLIPGMLAGLTLGAGMLAGMPEGGILGTALRLSYIQTCANACAASQGTSVRKVWSRILAAM